MIVCQCNAVSDRGIRKAIRHGATTVEAVGQACDAGTCCGGCRGEIERLLDTPEEHRITTELWPRRRRALRAAG